MGVGESFNLTEPQSVQMKSEGDIGAGLAKWLRGSVG